VSELARLKWTCMLVTSFKVRIWDSSLRRPPWLGKKARFPLLVRWWEIVPYVREIAPFTDAQFHRLHESTDGKFDMLSTLLMVSAGLERGFHNSPGLTWESLGLSTRYRLSVRLAVGKRRFRRIETRRRTFTQSGLQGGEKMVSERL
jgi:hypothetical protein